MPPFFLQPRQPDRLSPAPPQNKPCHPDHSRFSGGGKDPAFRFCSCFCLSPVFPATVGAPCPCILGRGMALHSTPHKNLDLWKKFADNYAHPCRLETVEKRPDSHRNRAFVFSGTGYPLLHTHQNLWFCGQTNASKGDKKCCLMSLKCRLRNTKISRNRQKINEMNAEIQKKCQKTPPPPPFPVENSKSQTAVVPPLPPQNLYSVNLWPPPSV